MPIVAILHEGIPQYRLPFFEGLREALARENVALRLGQGQPPASFAQRGDSVQRLPWATPLPTRHLRLGGRELVWLDPRPVIRGADLVIAIQQIRQLQNLVLWGLHQAGQLRLAWWGHGRDFAKSPDCASERFKRFLSARAHWWFAYNQISVRTVASLGFPEARITPVMNSTDTTPLRRMRETLTIGELEGLRQELGLGSGPVGIYVGALDRIKQIPYLLEAARVVRERCPGFHLLLVGNGPDGSALRASTAGTHWIHWVGPAFGREKVRLMALAQVCLLPAWVGLQIVDAFALGLPLVTTDTFPHSVEMDYLESGVNGWMVTGRPDAQAYGHAVADLLQNPERLARLGQAAEAAGRTYSLEAMVANFTQGILAALQAPPYVQQRR
jgi:glycosyltransferase involved in cell wall biosynthesis